MAVHVPLSSEAQAEARLLMLASGNLLKPSDGRPVVVPTQDMILGSYYLTLNKNDEKGEGKIFRDFDEAQLAYFSGAITLHSKIKVRRTGIFNGQPITKLVPTTVGKIIFNQPVPQDLGFVDRSDPEHCLDLEIDFLVGKKQLGKIIERCIITHGAAITSTVLDEIKSQGYKYSTKGALTVAVCDATIPPKKKEIIAEAEAEVEKITRDYRRGLITNDERYQLVIDVWDVATKAVATALTENMDEFNPINMMAQSGARGSANQIRQLAGMRGLIANTAGRTIEIPIRANYREGLNILEYFISSRGARKGLADTALRTADSGYLTRRLVDVSQEVIIREDDCGTTEGIEVYDILNGKEAIEPLSERLVGRYLVDDFCDEAGNVLVSKDSIMTDEDAKIIATSGVERIRIRSILTCRSKHGICKKCYGSNLATGKEVTTGEAVGIIAAQSIGEPGTQLTMRNFHTGGIANAEDITQGLPRVEELFEARKPKYLAILNREAGVVSFDFGKNHQQEVVVTNPNTGEAIHYPIPFGIRKLVHEGDHLKVGDKITDGSVNPHDLLEIMGVQVVQEYLIEEVQRVYRLQGVDINDKHIEVIVRQMMKKVRVNEPGSTLLLPGNLIEKSEFDAANAAVLRRREEEGNPDLALATCTPVLQGITKASLSTDSFLSAASFQETTKVLTDAAIRGKVDPLIGLKENVIIGQLVPAGTGMVRSDSQIIDVIDALDSGFND